MLSVYRVRPRDPNDDARSDEDFEDEQLILNENLLERAMRSRVGGKAFEDEHDVKEVINGKTSHEHNSRSAMDVAKRYGQKKTFVITKKALLRITMLKSVDAILAAAKASQRKEKRRGGGDAAERRKGTCVVCGLFSNCGRSASLV